MNTAQPNQSHNINYDYAHWRDNRMNITDIAELILINKLILILMKFYFQAKAVGA